MNTQNALVTFDPKAVATFGNQILNVIVNHEQARDAAELELRQAGEREKVIDFELTRVALHLHTKEEVDLYVIYDEKRDTTAKLYRQILVSTGVLTRTIDDETDNVLYAFTDEKLKNKFYFDEALKEKDENEYKSRRSRRNGLNMRLARVCKAALALYEAKATPDDMQVTKDDETGELSAVITKGPKEVMGKEGKVQIHAKSVSPVEGATATPTITGLAKFSDNKHKPVSETASKANIESGGREEGGAKDFTATVNAALMCIKALEGNPNAKQKALLKNVLTEIEKCVK